MLELLGGNLTNAEISQRLHIEEGTIKTQVHAILQKLEVGSRQQAAKYLETLKGKR